MVHAFVVHINNKYFTKTGVVSEEVLPLHLYFQNNVSGQTCALQRTGKTLLNLFSSQSKLSKFSFALRL